MMPKNIYEFVFHLPRIHIEAVTSRQNRKEVDTLNRLAEVPT